MENNIVVSDDSFNLNVDGYRAFLEFTEKPGVLDLYHTFVPEEIRGRGVAQKVISGALEYARENGLKVIPTCSAVKTYIERHPEWNDIVSK